MFELDASQSLWIIGILGTLLGIGLGSVITYAVVSRNRHSENLQAELDQLAGEFSEYRDHVSEHFMQTSNLVQEMTQSYRAVYEHLAKGAYHLCGEQADTRTLGHEPQADTPLAAGSENDDYDEMAELSSLREDIDSLLNDAPRFRKIDVAEDEKPPESVKH